MKIFKNYLVFPFISAGLLAVAFIYNIVFALIISADPALPYNILFYFFPLLIGMFLVYFGVKNNRRPIIYIGHMVNIICSLLLNIKIEEAIFAWTSDFPGIILLVFSIWPLILLAISLTLMAFVKTIDFVKKHRIIILISFFGLAINALAVLILMIIFAVQFSQASVFFAYVPTLLIFISLISVGALPSYTLEMATFESSDHSSFVEDVIKKAKQTKRKKESKKEEKVEEEIIDVEIED